MFSICNSSAASCPDLTKFKDSIWPINSKWQSFLLFFVHFWSHIHRWARVTSDFALRKVGSGVAQGRVPSAVTSAPTLFTFKHFLHLFLSWQPPGFFTFQWAVLFSLAVIFTSPQPLNGMSQGTNFFSILFFNWSH